MKKLTNIFFVLILLLGGWSLSSCDEYPFLSGEEGTEQDTITTEKAILYASVSEIMADGKDEVILSVKVGDVDVTDSACFYVDDELMETNRFSTSNAGSYKFYAVYKGVNTNNVELTASPVVRLSASASIIVADGEDELLLSVMLGDVDVTDSAYLYVDNKRMSSNRFTTTKAGSYKFFASYKGKITSNVVVTAANPALYVALPEDSMPEVFEGFERNVLIAEATGTWCGYCPFMIRALELFEERGSNAGNAVIVAMHSGDTFSNEASEAAVAASKVSGFPSCVVNLDPEVLIENAQPDVNAENINTVVGMELKEAARVGVAATVATNQDSSMVAVRAAVKVGKDGNYRVNAWLIEDGVAASQSSNWAEFSDGKSSVVIDHMHILRGASCTSPIQGALLGGKETSAAGEVIEFYHEFNAKKAAVKSVANCKILVLVTVTNGTSSKYVVNNIIECPVGEAIPFAYKN